MRRCHALLCGFHKIPFTCSYLPGRSYFHMGFIAFVLLMLIINRGATLEVDALGSEPSALLMIGVLAFVAFAARARTPAGAGSSEMIRFEERDQPVIESLGLGRDGTPVADDVQGK